MGKSNTKLPGFNNCAQYFAAAKNSKDSRGGDGRHRRGGLGGRTCYPEWSGKMLLLDRLMYSMRKTTADRIVIVSNYTQTLDVVSTLCQERQLPFVRLDGTTSAKKRKKLVDTFNDPTTNSFAFLLSSKAGGCGLNLIGANRLVLFDPDWNPATDKQAAARVWREGQTKMCYVYRFLATGTLEEKIFQRQLSKEGLQNIVDDKEEVNSLSSKDLKRLFVFRKDTMSDTHDQLKCDRCQWREDSHASDDKVSSPIVIDDVVTNEKGIENKTLYEKEISSQENATDKGYHPQIGMPPEEDLNNWGHHRSYASVDDEVMQAALQQVENDLVSFAFSCRIDWELLQEHHAENQKKDIKRDQERKRKRLEIIEAANHCAEKKRASQSVKRKNLKSFGDSDDSEVEFPGSDGEELNEVLFENDSNESEDSSLSGHQRSPATFEVDVLCNPKPTFHRPTQSLDNRVVSEDKDAVPGQSNRNVSFALEVDEASWSPSKIQTTSQTSDFEDEDVFVSDVLRDHHTMRNKEISTSDVGSENTLSVTWSCLRCTLINSETNGSCSSCGYRYQRSRPKIIDLSDDEEEEC
ncbi:putative helicase, Zinc finger, RanBP2-type, P-loop containing nucleoside triphosphate hydrolase [Plasmopara halstedii]